jgi:hypothetical protein
MIVWPWLELRPLVGSRNEAPRGRSLSYSGSSYMSRGRLCEAGSTDMRLGIIGALAFGLLALPGCGLEANPGTDGMPPATRRPPCTPATIAELGRPLRSRAPTAALFTTTGGTIYFMARNFDHGGILDISPGSTAVYVGQADTPPSYDARRGVVSPAPFQTSVPENEYAALDLPAGRYWLLVSSPADIVAVGCPAGLVHDVQAQPVPSPTA